MVERRDSTDEQGGEASVTEKRIAFRRFHHVTMAVADFDAAVADWSERLGWPVSAASAAERHLRARGLLRRAGRGRGRGVPG